MHKSLRVSYKAKNLTPVYTYIYIYISFCVPKPLFMLQALHISRSLSIYIYTYIRDDRVLDHCVRDAVRNVDKPKKVQKALMTWNKKATTAFQR